LTFGTKQAKPVHNRWYTISRQGIWKDLCGLLQADHGCSRQEVIDKNKSINEGTLPVNSY
jgi:hypothetical protein